MNTVHVLCHLTRADFLERVRRSGFLIVLATAVFAGYLFVPPEGAGYRVLQVGVQRGIYNSSWIGLMFGLIAAMHLPLVGFFLVKNTVERDRRSGVGQIIATTPISKLAYVVGKWLSNLAVLALILGVLTVMALLMQVIRGEDLLIRPWTLVATIWLMGLPVLAIAAALAVLFECTPFLRGSLGNVVFFFAWLAVLITVLTGAIDEITGLFRPTNDIVGFTRSMADVQRQVLAAYPDADVGSGLVVTGRDVERTLTWEGLGWKLDFILGRVMWAGVAVLFTLFAAVPFDRFDPARRGLKREGGGFFRSLQARTAAIPWPGFLQRQPLATDGLDAPTAYHLTPLADRPYRGRFVGVLVAELKLMLRGHSLLWYIVSIGLVIAFVVSPPDEVARRVLLLAVWVWPVFVWSQLGVRERRYSTEQMIFSVPRPVSRQISALWLAGVIFTLMIGSGALLRMALVGDASHLFAWSVGALFCPALALTLGVWTGHSRAFELIYLFCWYIGLANRMPALDYAGATAESLTMGMPVVYLGVTAGLLVLAALGRRRRMQT